MSVGFFNGIYRADLFLGYSAAAYRGRRERPLTRYHAKNTWMIRQTCCRFDIISYFRLRDRLVRSCWPRPGFSYSITSTHLSLCLGSESWGETKSETVLGVMVKWNSNINLTWFGGSVDRHDWIILFYIINNCNWRRENGLTQKSLGNLLELDQIDVSDFLFTCCCTARNQGQGQSLITKRRNITQWSNCELTLRTINHLRKIIWYFETRASVHCDSSNKT